MKEFRKILRETLPGVMGGLIVGAVFAAIGWLYTGIGIWTLVLVAAGIVGLGCSYLIVKRTTWRRQCFKGRGYVAFATMLVVVGLLLVASNAVSIYRLLWFRPFTKVIVLVADFEGPAPQEYRVTETILERLREATEKYSDVQVQALSEPITAQQGSDVARVKGVEHKANIVIWGWYGVTGEAAPLSVHLEVLSPLKDIPELPVLGPEAKGRIRRALLTELDSFTLQPRLSEEMAYLTLFILGVARYAAGDLDGAITHYSDALNQVVEPITVLDKSTIYFNRGIAHYDKEEYDHALADFHQASDFQPYNAVSFNNRGVAYYLKGDLNLAEADFNRAIELSSDYAEPYNALGLIYLNREKYDGDRAIAYFDLAIKFRPNYTEAYHSRAIAYLHEGEWEKARTDLNMYLSLIGDLNQRQKEEKELSVWLTPSRAWPNPTADSTLVPSPHRAPPPPTIE